MIVRVPVRVPVAVAMNVAVARPVLMTVLNPMIVMVCLHVVVSGGHVVSHDRLQRSIRAPEEVFKQ